MFLLIFCTKTDSLKPGAPLKGVGAPFYIRLRDFLQNYLATLVLHELLFSTVKERLLSPVSDNVKKIMEPTT